MPHPLRLTLALALGLAACLALGCGPARARRQGPPPAPIGTLHAPSHYRASFAIDQEVTAEYEGGSQSFRAVAELADGRLVMVGLGPHGGRAFTLVQEGDDVRFESQMPRELPFPPEFILMDVHRTWIVGLPRPRGEALADGEHEGTIDDERVEERWQHGRLLERRYRPLDASRGWAIDIAYEGGLGEDALPSRVVLDSTPAPGQRYRLVLTNLSGTWSSGASEAPTAGGEAPPSDAAPREDAPADQALEPGAAIDGE